jgi:hypothetical protein
MGFLCGDVGGRGRHFKPIVSEFDAAFGEDGRLQRAKAARTSDGLGQRLDEFGFLEADGLKFVLVVAQELVVLGGVGCGN